MSKINNYFAKLKAKKQEEKQKKTNQLYYGGRYDSKTNTYTYVNEEELNLAKDDESSGSEGYDDFH